MQAPLWERGKWQIVLAGDKLQLCVTNGYVRDWPIRTAANQVAYDDPDRIPEFVKTAVKNFL